jgi:zinc protease
MMTTMAPALEAAGKAGAEMETMTPVGIVVAGFFGADAVDVRDSRLLQMSSRVLSTRMIKKLREEEQLVYSIGVQSQPGTVFPGYGLVFAAAPTDPSKTAKLGERVHEMFAEFAAGGPTEEELTVARKQFANQIDEAMKQPGFWSQQLSNLAYRGRLLDDVMNSNEAFQAFSASDLREGFARYYIPENRMVVSVRPVAPAAVPAAPVP